MWANAQRDGRPAEHIAADIQSPTAEIRPRKKERRNDRAKYNVRICYAGRPYYL